MTLGRRLSCAVLAVCSAVLFAATCVRTDNENKTMAALLAAYRVNMPDTPSDLSEITEAQINHAKSTLHIAYGHTSHGSQVITGMTAIAAYKGELFAFNDGGAGGALDLRDGPFTGAADLGNPDGTSWEGATRDYLDANADINVIIWSWCGQVSSASEADITTYLTLMSGLETDYPGVTFVYMTGHTDGSGLEGNLHIRNQQIRDYCRLHGKYLYDFETIESYDPDDAYFGDRWVDDGCNYDSDGNGSRDGNWATGWTIANPSSELTRMAASICSDCCAHSRPLNCVMKGAAAWTLWVTIAAERH